MLPAGAVDEGADAVIPLRFAEPILDDGIHRQFVILYPVACTIGCQNA
jgi:hypothetical protein